MPLLRAAEPRVARRLAALLLVNLATHPLVWFLFPGLAARSLSVARHMGPAADVFARVMGPPNRQGHGARVAGDRTLDRQGHGASRSPGSWGHLMS